MNNSNKRCSISVCLILFIVYLNGQNRFNITLPYLEDTNQSRLFDSYPDSNIIFVIGDLQDTSIDSLNPRIIPWWGILNYDGEILKQNLLFNESIKGSIVVPGNTVLKNSKGNLVYNTILFNENNIANSIIIEIDKNNGDIINHKIFENTLDSLKNVLPAWITFQNKSSPNIIHGATLKIGEFPRGYINILDSNLNIISSLIIDDNGRDNYLYYLEQDSDSTFVLLGESGKRNEHSSTPDIKPYFMRVDAVGKIIEFKLASGIADKTIFFSTADSYNIAKDSQGNWIFGAISYFPNNRSVPYIYSYSPHFDTLNWARNFSENPEDLNEDNSIFSAVFDSISHSLVVCGSNFNQSNNDSYVFKIRENGDSLWTRHFIPLNWDQDSVIFALLRDIRITEYGTYICVGHASNRQQGLWHSWAINIDSFGCLIPGCQNTVSLLDLNDEISKPFIFYPNPASSYLGVLCTSNSFNNLILSIFDSSGILIKDLKFNPNSGYQYLLDTSNFIEGLYFINVTDMHGTLIQTEKIIIN